MDGLVDDLKNLWGVGLTPFEVVRVRVMEEDESLRRDPGGHPLEESSVEIERDVLDHIGKYHDVERFVQIELQYVGRDQSHVRERGQALPRRLDALRAQVHTEQRALRIERFSKQARESTDPTPDLQNTVFRAQTEAARPGQDGVVALVDPYRHLAADVLVIERT